jgi:hypothetical protein
VQIIEIKNIPLTPHIIINLYIPTHQEDLALIPIIQENIKKIIHEKSSHSIILLGDFSTNIKFIGRYNYHTWNPSTKEDHEWTNFTNSLQLTYIPTNTIFTQQHNN